MILSLPARIVALTRTIVRGLFVHHAFDHAATMALYFFLGTIPLLLVAGLLVGHLVEKEGSAMLGAPLCRFVPAVTADLIRDELRAIAATDASSIAPLSVAGFLWLTSNGFHNLMDVFELLIGARQKAAHGPRDRELDPGDGHREPFEVPSGSAASF